MTRTASHAQQGDGFPMLLLDPEDMDIYSRLGVREDLIPASLPPGTQPVFTTVFTIVTT